MLEVRVCRGARRWLLGQVLAPAHERSQSRYLLVDDALCKHTGPHRHAGQATAATCVQSSVRETSAGATGLAVGTSTRLAIVEVLESHTWLPDAGARHVATRSAMRARSAKMATWPHPCSTARSTPTRTSIVLSGCTRAPQGDGSRDTSGAAASTTRCSARSRLARMP